MQLRATEPPSHRPTEPLNSRYMCNGSVLHVSIPSFSPIRPTPRTGSSRRKDSIDAITYAGVWGRKHGRSNLAHVEFS
ncbi:hypothetical protein N7493_006385 [Penicillium malachiteum]|uniref:Uncharacterized protein n=1 Tax=Penicillium malachiteum TaxID=1324776 RepID=A0AAD6HKG3_9EURO|nr:hypothetical protein N7493_006385 [Penicillium malachiteum]